MKPLYVRIGGGLGNQMFNYAVGLKIAATTGRQLILDSTEFLLIKDRRYDLRIFSGPAAVRSVGLIRSLLFLVVRVLQRFSSGELLLRVFGIRWITTGNDADAFLRICQAGTFVTEKRAVYVSGCYGIIPLLPARDVIRQSFGFPAKMSNAVRAWIEKIRTAEERSVSLHIRRGDYLLALNGTPALGEAYYRRAINMMRQRVGNPQWFIFSDDIDWCRQKFVDLEGACFVTGNEDTPWEDIRLMSSCRNHIIANSTFSWWGAFLASEAGVTVCPNPWFKGMPTCADVMVPEDWLLCDSLDGGEEPVE